MNRKCAGSHETEESSWHCWLNFKDNVFATSGNFVFRILLNEKAKFMVMTAQRYVSGVKYRESNGFNMTQLVVCANHPGIRSRGLWLDAPLPAVGSISHPGISEKMTRASKPIKPKLDKRKRPAVKAS